MKLPYVAIALLLFATAYSAIVSFRQHGGGKRSWIFPESASRAVQLFVGVLTLGLLAGLALWLGMSTRNSTLRSSRFLIPEGYAGWIRIEFEVQGAPRLPIEGGQYVLKIPSDGVLRTSSAEQYGWAKDQYYYYSAQGVRSLPDSGPAELIWGKINGEESGVSGKRKYEEFFVGNAQQFKDQAK
ncbi:MAG: hypothetical protein WCA20_10540 [Candidatus Sulfotelmatobacter sp.]